MAVPAEKIQNAGDVSIDEVVIVTSTGSIQEVTPQVLAIELYEDIFAPFLSGNVILKDSQEIVGLLPLIGEELIRMTISTPSLDTKENISMEFMIYKMDDRQKLKDREIIYTLHFISKEAIVDLNRKLSRGYEGLISDMVQDIYKKGLETTKNVNVEPTKNKTKFIANYWSPVKCLQFLAEQALNPNDSPSYVFFENNYGFHYVSLDTLYTGTVIKQRFIWDNYTAETRSTGGSDRSIEKDYQRIIEFVQHPEWNYIDRLKSGMYGSQIMYFDLMTHQYVHVGYSPAFTKGNHLNKYPLWSGKVPQNSQAVMTREHQYYNAFDGYGDVSNTGMCQERRSLLAQAEGYKVSINVLGRCDYHIGQRMYLEIPRMTQLKPDDPNYLDQLTSGCYLVSAICHKINRAKHECTMELVKDSYMRDIRQ